AGVVAMLPALAGDATPARSASDAATAKLDVAVDQMVDVELLSGAKYEQATLLRVVDDNVGEPKSVRVRLETGQSRTVRLSAVRTIHHAGHELYRADEEAPNKPKTKKQQRVEE